MPFSFIRIEVPKICSVNYFVVNQELLHQTSIYTRTQSIPTPLRVCMWVFIHTYMHALIYLGCGFHVGMRVTFKGGQQYYSCIMLLDIIHRHKLLDIITYIFKNLFYLNTIDP